MLDIDSGRYYLLDDIASFIWTRLADPRSVGALVSDLQERYEVTPEQLESDVLPFLAHLHDKGLVRHVR